MRPGHVRERPYGIRYYASSTPGIGGYLRATPEDFRVTERMTGEFESLDADPGSYPYLILQVTLTDWDTHRFIDELSSALQIHPQRIAWAGTKDAVAVTTQHLSIRMATPTSLPTFDGVELRPIGRAGRQLEFGDHAGNDFEITVREVDHPDRIEPITRELQIPSTDALGIANFFGPQRFGLQRPITHRVGRAILAGDPRMAVLRYLTDSSPHEPSRTRQAREQIEAAVDGDSSWAEAYAHCPGYLDHERTMLAVLADTGEPSEASFQAALEALPWSLQRLFVHAVQSHAFNEIISERLRRGLPFDEPVVGDIICMANEEGHIDVDRPQLVSADRLGPAKRHCARGRAVVTAPLVGTETTLARGEPGRIERSVLASLDLDHQTFDHPTIGEITGTRRPVRIETEMTITTDPVRFAFGLPPGAYATVVLREYLKGDPLAMA